MQKEKPCKGIGKAKHFKGCKEVVLAQTRKYGLCPSCYRDFLLYDDVGKDLLKKATLKASKPRLELQRERALKQERKSLQSLLNGVKIVCHQYIRLRDKGKPCISSGIPYKNDFQAGHYFKSELYSWIRFDEDNIHGQSVYDNCLQDGNFHGYAQNIVKRIGLDRYEALKRRAEEGKKTPFKWDREELKKIRDYYRNKIKELKNEGLDKTA